MHPSLPSGETIPLDPFYAIQAHPLPAHPYAEIFPLMARDDLEKLADDIQKHGQAEPIMLYKAQIVDGRNRQEACFLRGIPPLYTQWKGTDDEESLLHYIWSKGAPRRHLTKSQLGMAGARRFLLLQEIKDKKQEPLLPSLVGTHGQEEHNESERARLRMVRIAQEMGLSAATLWSAKKIIECGSEDLIQSVEEGSRTVGGATKLLAHVQYRREVPKRAKREPQIYTDKHGKLIPKHLLSIFKASSCCTRLIKDLTNKKIHIKRMADSPIGCFLDGRIDEINIHLDAIVTIIKSSRPYTTCPICKGIGMARNGVDGEFLSCPICDGGGWVSEAIYSRLSK